MRFSDEAVLRLVVAVVLGAIVGTEREANDQPAGLRTHIAICLGAALFDGWTVLFTCTAAPGRSLKTPEVATSSPGFTPEATAT